MSHRTCEIDGCANKFLARGLCSKHYWRNKRAGTLPPKKAYPTHCAVEDCEADAKAKGYCGPHYDRLRRYGDPTYTPLLSTQEFFRENLEHQGDCIVWTAGSTTTGYGTIHVGDGKFVPAHRYSWELEKGPIPDGLVIDHICWNRKCVRVDHLRLATRSQNNSYRKPVIRETASGVRNVARNKKGWMVKLTKNYQQYYFGTYGTIEEAAEVAEQARQDLFGEFAGGA